MKRLSLIFLSLFVCLGLSAQTEEGAADSLDRYKGLDDLLDQFYVTMERASLEAKYEEFDGLISTCQDSLTRQHVALQIFDHYCYSRVMGEEAVAIHIYDEWIASGKVKTRSEFEQLIDDQYVLFNRGNLVGMTAQQVTLYKPHVGTRTVPVPGRITVMFFYDTQCSKCRLESRVLPGVLEEVDFPMDFVAVYVGDDRREWKNFRPTLKVRNRKVRTFHLWDPQVDSDYQLAYGVTATPRLYVVWKDGEIIGRRLEVTNLKEVLHYITVANNAEEEKAE